MGEKHKTLQSQLKTYLDMENVELLTNGHMALELSIQAMGLKGEVITTILLLPVLLMPLLEIICDRDFVILERTILL